MMTAKQITVLEQWDKSFDNAKAKPPVAGSATGSPASFDAGVWFQSACSGLWYEVKNAGGDISAVRIDGVTYKRQ